MLFNPWLCGVWAECSPTLLFRDISYGREANPVPVVNDCDDENYPRDFLYVSENVETAPMNVNRTITSLRVCYQWPLSLVLVVPQTYELGGAGNHTS